MTRAPSTGRQPPSDKRRSSRAHTIGLYLAGFYLVAGGGRVLSWLSKDPLALLSLPFVIVYCGILYFTPRVLAWAFRELASSRRRYLASVAAIGLLLGATFLVLRFSGRVLALVVGPSDYAFSGVVGRILAPSVRFDPVVRSIVTEGCRLSGPNRLTMARLEAAALNSERATGSFAFLFNVPPSAAVNLGRYCEDLATQEILLQAKDQWVRREVINSSYLHPSLCSRLSREEIAFRSGMGSSTCSGALDGVPSKAPAP